jgi:predicted TIM-barrel enzyme
VKTVKKAVPDRPLFAGSGITLENVDSFLNLVDGFIVGTSLKEGGHVENHVDICRVREFMKKCEAHTHQ